MWLYFNASGQLVDSIEHGMQARSGTTAFQIFAYFEGVDLSASNTATIKLVKPDFDNSAYPLLAMKHAEETFEKLPGETSSYFSETGGPNHDGIYPGFLFDFSDFNGDQDAAVLLDTPGLWKAVISLYNTLGAINVQGTATFDVQYGILVTDGTELDIDQIMSSYAAALAGKLNISSGIVVTDDHTTINVSAYSSYQLFYDRSDKKFYQLFGGNIVSFDFGYLKISSSKTPSSTINDLYSEFGNQPFVLCYSYGETAYFVAQIRNYGGYYNFEFIPVYAKTGYETYDNIFSVRYAGRVSNSATTALGSILYVNSPYQEPLATVDDVEEYVNNHALNIVGVQSSDIISSYFSTYGEQFIATWGYYTVLVKKYSTLYIVLTDLVNPERYWVNNYSDSLTFANAIGSSAEKILAQTTEVVGFLKNTVNVNSTLTLSGLYGQISPFYPKDGTPVVVTFTNLNAFTNATYLCELWKSGSNYDFVFIPLYSQESILDVQRWYKRYQGSIVAGTTLLTTILADGSSYEQKLASEDWVNNKFYTYEATISSFPSTISLSTTIVNNLKNTPDSEILVRITGDSTSYYLFKKVQNAATPGCIWICIDKDLKLYRATVGSDSLTLVEVGDLSTQDWVNSQIATAMTSSIIYQGSLTVAQINALDTSTLKVGYLYNVSDSGTITLGDVEVLAGDNIIWTGSGWDKLTMDWSAYDEKFISAGFFVVEDYDEDDGEITIAYSSDLYVMDYTDSTGILEIEAI